MAIDKKVLRTRGLSSAIFILVMMAAWLAGKVYFAAINGVILCGILYEWGKLSCKIKDVHNSYYAWGLTGIGGLLYLLLLYFYFYISHTPGDLYASEGIDAMFDLQLIFGLIFGALLIVVTLFSRDFARLFLFSEYIIGLLFFFCSFGMLIPLYDWQVPFIILFSVWINDTMAYLIGSQIGKTPLAAKISPNKTWEGTIGGVVSTILVAYIVSFYYDGDNETHYYTQLQIVTMSFISAVMGTVGDLIQSSIKRMAGAKDSGNIMPGHGGFYDRFDAFSFAIVWVSAYLYFYV